MQVSGEVVQHQTFTLFSWIVLIVTGLHDTLKLQHQTNSPPPAYKSLLVVLAELLH